MHDRVRREERRRERSEREPQDVPAPHEIHSLQRTVGNQAVTRLLSRAQLQRKPVTPRQYMTDIVAAGSADPEWDPHWTTAVNYVLSQGTFDVAFTGTIDDELDADAEKVVAKLKALAELSNDKPNRHRIATDAVRWHAGIDSTSGGSGFGTIEMSNEGITGRPAFPLFTQQNIPVKAGQHRRHILAWHTMREFVTKAYAAQRNAVIQPMRNAFSTPPDPVSAFAFTEAFQHVVSGRQRAHAGDGDLTDEEVLKVGLFVMNGNPRNLWAGRGSTNSALNTAQMAMHKALNEVHTFSDLDAVVTRWQDAKGKAVYSAATELGAQVALHFGKAALQAYANDADEEEVVHGVADKVREYVLSNLEIDVLGDSKAQTELAQEKALQLSDARGLIDNVARGVVDVGQVPDWIISEAVGQYLRYA